MAPPIGVRICIVRLAKLSDCSSCDCIQVPRFCADLLLHLGRVVGGICRTVPQDCFVDAMATGNSQPKTDRKGIDFRVHVQIPWNAPEAFVTLDSPGVFVLGTAYVQDVLGLRPRYPDAAPVKVLKGRTQESRSAAHASLRGKYMAKFRSFTVWAEAEARWESGRLSQHSTTGSRR